MGGGQVVVKKGKILAALPLPIAGLMSDRPLSEVHQLSQELKKSCEILGRDASRSLHVAFLFGFTGDPGP